jgi:uncharacterized protein YdeI (YjbR/CyaY-like superfamily)
MKPLYFQTPAAFRQWLHDNHAVKTELLVAFHKKSSNKPSITYHQALDQALCFGWIDGVRKSLNSTSYTIRFTPRKPKSYWSNVNTARANELLRQNLMHPHGAKVFAARDLAVTNRYSFERQTAKFPPAFLRQFKSHPPAWHFFESQPPYYQRIATFWVVSAKQDATRQRRLQTLIVTSAGNCRLPQLVAKPKKT